ncbi:MAG TPA: hypothetical protein VMV75_00925 [Sulfuricella sp.]|nr:hypothetical protein [Sulfuricella sp.]
METNSWLLISVFAIGLVALLGFFITKTKGFGRFATSTFLLLLVVVLSGLLYAANKLDCQVLANIFFAVIGFAGGLFTGKETPNPAVNTDAAR